MTETDLFAGKLVRLAVVDAKTAAEAFARWNRDSEYLRLLDSSPTVQFSLEKFKEWLEKGLADQPGGKATPPSSYYFMVQAIDDGRLISLVGLDGDMIPHGEAFVGIGIGERGLWGKGYGTDAMNLILRYAFMELNLRRISLDTFEYNPRAIHSYEKVGFVQRAAAASICTATASAGTCSSWASCAKSGWR